MLRLTNPHPIAIPVRGKKRKIVNRLGECWICHKAEAIYTCPRCETVTCSLQCVKNHKVQLDCDGTRNRTNYVALKKMNELNLLSDYRLLEDIQRCVETAESIRESIENPHPIPVESMPVKDVKSANDTTAESTPVLTVDPQKNDFTSVITDNNACVEQQVSNSRSPVLQTKRETENSHNKKNKREVPWNKNANLSSNSKALYRNKLKRGGFAKRNVRRSLVQAAYTRGILLSFLPESFEKHLDNTSFYYRNDDCIYWRLRISFISASFYTISLPECADNVVLEKLLKYCLRQTRNYSRKRGRCDPLSVYSKMGVLNMSVLMSTDKLSNSKKKFYVLDKEKTLRENFEGKCIVEFPELCIALDDCYVVSKVREKNNTSFFDGNHYFSDTEESELQANKRKYDKEKKSKKKLTQGAESDRESGELTDSSNGGCSDDSDTGEDNGELYNDGEFRSMYKDLLTTFDDDVRKSNNL